MRSLSILIVISALALDGACSSKQPNAPAPAAPDVAKVAPVTPEVNVPGGGGCTYSKFAGTCELTAVGDAPVMTFKGTVEGAAVELPGNTVSDPRAFEPFALGTSAPCTIELETRGTCTPCLFSVGECGQAAWEVSGAHRK